MRKLSNSLLFLAFSMLLLQAGCFEGCSGIDVADLPLDESYIIDYGKMAKSNEINAATSAYAHLRKSFYEPADVFAKERQTMEQLITQLEGLAAIGNNAAYSLQNALDVLSPEMISAANSSDEAKDFADLIKNELVDQKYRGDHDAPTNISTFIVSNCFRVDAAKKSSCISTLNNLSNFIDNFYSKAAVLANKLAQDEMLVDLAETDRKIAELKVKIGSDIVPVDTDANSDIELAITKYSNASYALKKYIEQMSSVTAVANLIADSSLKLTERINEINTLVLDNAKIADAGQQAIATNLVKEALDEMNKLTTKSANYVAIEALKKDPNKEISNKLSLAFASGYDFATEKQVEISGKNKTDLNNVLDELSIMDDGILFLSIPQKGSADEFVKSLAVAIVNFQSDLSGNRIDNIYGLNKTKLFEVATSYGMDFAQRKLFLQKQAKNAAELKSDNGKYKNIFVVNAADYESLEETSAIVSALKDTSRVLVLSKNNSPSDELESSLASEAIIFRLTGLKGNEAQLVSKKFAEELNSSRTNKLSVQVVSDTLGKIVASGFVKKGIGLAQTENVVRQVFAQIPATGKSTADQLKNAVLNAMATNLGVNQSEVKSSGVLTDSMTMVLDNVKNDEEYYLDRVVKGTSANTSLGLAQIKAAEEINKRLVSIKENKTMKRTIENSFNLFRNKINAQLEKIKKAQENDVTDDDMKKSKNTKEFYELSVGMAEKYREMLDTVYSLTDATLVNEYIENNKADYNTPAFVLSTMKDILADNQEIDDAETVGEFYNKISPPSLDNIMTIFSDGNLSDPIFAQASTKKMLQNIAKAIAVISNQMSSIVAIL